MKKEKILVIAIIAVFIGYAAYIFLRSEIGEKNRKKEAGEKAIETFPRFCEAGQWISVSKGNANSRGERYQARIKLAPKDGFLQDENGENIFISSYDLPLDYFSGKELEIIGARTGEIKGKEVFVNKLRCVGTETSKEFLANRRKIMEYVSENINTLSNIRTQAGWKAEAFYFVNENDFYVEYVSVKNNQEIMQCLMRASKFERPAPVLESLAYFKINPNSREKELMGGEDRQKDGALFSKYIFNSETKKWEIQ